MKGERSLWIAIGLVVSGLATFVLGGMTMSGFSGGSGGDMAASSASMSSNLLLALGAALLLGLEFAHTMRHRPSRPRRLAATREAVEA
jgi:hypothetical protein